MATASINPYLYAGPSPFPPSFDGNPWAYGFGLFGDIVASSLALAMLIALVLEPRRNAEVSRILRNPLPLPDHPVWSPLFIYRAANISMLLFVVMRTLPDALWMLAWGEISEPSIRTMLALDLWFDGLALGPFFFSVLCWTWGRQVIPQKLISGLNVEVGRGPSWGLLWRNGRIVLIVLVIAIGVTIGKASG